MMTLEQFLHLGTQGYNRLPLMREVLADLDTPLSTYLKLANRPYSYLLESVQGGETWGRYSIIGLSSRVVIKVCGQVIRVECEGGLVETITTPDPLAWLEQYQTRYKAPAVTGLPRFTGGLVGYFGYDTIRYIEPRLTQTKPDPLANPDIVLMLSDEVVVFDNLRGTLALIIHADPQQTNAYTQAVQRLDELERKLYTALPCPPQAAAPVSVTETDFHSEFGRAEFEAAVEQAKAYIQAGDIMQVVLSQRLSIPYQASPLSLYRALRQLNPSPYLFYFNLDSVFVVGASPEILVRLEEGQVTVRPIAGTRPRGQTVEQDQALERELLADPKELAEHLMLIDLGRNDVGRIATTGSVQLTEKMQIERYSHVMHIVSNVTGQLLPGKTPVAVLRATFPAGTLSGAPKIRAMEIIAELEPTARGIYGGAVGYLSWQGNMDLAIAIRTAVIQNGQLFVQVGAGIVADSIPAQEWEETMNKGRAIFRAVALAAELSSPITHKHTGI